MCDEAIPHLEEGLSLNLDVPHALNSYALCLASSGRLVEALGFLSKGLEYEPDSPWLHGNSAAVFIALGQYQQAQLHARRAVDLSLAQLGYVNGKFSHNLDLAEGLLRGEGATEGPQLELFYHRML
jgi:tetratricopeptide (TPR) repeat protein